MLPRIIHYMSHRWQCEGGYRDIFVMAIPLILSTGSWAIQHRVRYYAWVDMLASVSAGKWKTMRVIEEIPPFTSPTFPETPIAEYEL